MRTNERVRRSSKKQENKKPAQDVVYMPPKPFNRNRFLLHLATVAAVVVAILLGISLFFKVNPDKILVSGNYKYTEWDIAEASGLKGGENLLTLNKGSISGKIILELRSRSPMPFRISRMPGGSSVPAVKSWRKRKTARRRTAPGCWVSALKIPRSVMPPGLRKAAKAEPTARAIRCLCW